MMPILTIAGVLLPVICVRAAFVLSKGNPGSGGWGLGELFMFVVLIAAGGVIGAVCTGLALWRGEPGRPLQVIVLVASVAVAVYFGRPFLRRHVPDRPVGMPAYLKLAPVAERVRPEAIVLAYPAPASPDSAGVQRVVVGKQEPGGLVTSVWTAPLGTPLKPGELYLGLDAVDGRWAVRRDWDFVAKISDRKWRRATYLEVTVNLSNIGIPVGASDDKFWPLR